MTSLATGVKSDPVLVQLVPHFLSAPKRQARLSSVESSPVGKLLRPRFSCDACYFLLMIFFNIIVTIIHQLFVGVDLSLWLSACRISLQSLQDHTAARPHNGNRFRLFGVRRAMMQC